MALHNSSNKNLKYNNSNYLNNNSNSLPSSSFSHSSHLINLLIRRCSRVLLDFLKETISKVSGDHSNRPKISTVNLRVFLAHFPNNKLIKVPNNSSNLLFLISNLNPLVERKGSWILGGLLKSLTTAKALLVSKRQNKMRQYHKIRKANCKHKKNHQKINKNLTKKIKLISLQNQKLKPKEKKQI